VLTKRGKGFRKKGDFMDDSNYILDEDLLDSYGRLLLSKGSRINKEILYSLKKRDLLNKVIFSRESDSCTRVAPKKVANDALVGKLEHYSSEAIRNSTAFHTNSIFKRTPSINIELTARASSLVSDLIYLSRSQSWGLPINALFNHMPWVYSHSVNVAILACAFSYWLKIDDERIREIAIGALLHDVGKVLIPIEIINKPGGLSGEEWLLIKAHPRLGYGMLEPYNLSKGILDIILQHHERFDGKGYPQGLNGSQITLPVQVVTIADTFDGVTSDRPYHSARNIKETLSILDQEREVFFKSYMLEEFKRMIGVSYI